MSAKVNQAPSVSLSGVWMRTLWVLNAVIRSKKGYKEVRALCELVKDSEKSYVRDHISLACHTVRRKGV